MAERKQHICDRCGAIDQGLRCVACGRIGWLQFIWIFLAAVLSIGGCFWIVAHMIKKESLTVLQGWIVFFVGAAGLKLTFSFLAFLLRFGTIGVEVIGRKKPNID